MKFKDVAHLYVGCKVITEDGYITILSGIDIDDPHFPTLKDEKEDECGIWSYEGIKPLLYPLSAMTEEQYIEANRAYGAFENEIWFTPSEFKFLLDNHIDLFGLIESGEAIDVTTLDINPYL